MKDKKENVDHLLQRNAEEQLADFDWERLSGAIMSRLDEAQHRKTSAVGFGAVVRIAAGMAAAAAIILIAVTIMQQEPVTTPADMPGTATVELSEPQGTASVTATDRSQVVVAVSAHDEGQMSGTASVQISSVSDRPQVAVDIHTRDREPVLCRVEIIRPDESPGRDQSDGAWIVVAGYAPRLVEDRVSRDMLSMMCLF